MDWIVRSYDWSGITERRERETASGDGWVEVGGSPTLVAR